jgi:hypothetical protein
MFSDQNPMMQLVATTAEKVRQERRPAGEDNPFLAAEKLMSSWISASLGAAGKARDAMTEAMFLNTYGSPLLQALTGLGPESPRRRHIERDLAREVDERQRRAELEHRFERGDALDAMLRALIYVRAADGTVDERGYVTLQALRAAQPKRNRVSSAELKASMREQFLLHRLDQERAIAAIPRLLPKDAKDRRALLEAMRRILSAQGELGDEAKRRFARIESLFDVDAAPPASKESRDA